MNEKRLAIMILVLATATGCGRDVKKKNEGEGQISEGKKNEQSIYAKIALGGKYDVHYLELSHYNESEKTEIPEQINIETGKKISDDNLIGIYEGALLSLKLGA